MSKESIKQVKTPSIGLYPEHGGNPKAIAKESGVNAERIIDFSASINPLGPPGCVPQLLLETPHLIKEYPDPHCSLILKRISETTEIPQDCIKVGNGSTEIIYLLPHLLQKDQEVAIFNPCFSEYENALAAFGVTTHSIAFTSPNNFQSNPSLNFSELDPIKQLGAVVIGHPASPTGKLYTDFLPELQKYCDKRNVILIVDEAFIDFSSTDNSAWSLLKRNSNLILIRSLTKFYSIPGLRLGYGVLHPDKLQRIAAYQYPWSVNGLAQAVGAEVLLDETFQEKTRSWVTRENDFMFQALSAISEVEVFSSDVNFFLFRVRDDNPSASHDLFQHLLSRFLLIRNCGNFKGLDDSFFRISLRERSENQKLVDAIAEFFLS